MHLTASAFALWTFTLILEGLLCALVVRRRLWRRLPLFTAYIVIKLCVTGALALIYARIGYNSIFAYRFYWSAQSLLLISRAAVCAELCWMTFKSRPGLWVHARAVLIVITGGILVYAGVDAYRQASAVTITRVILTLERGLELNIAILLTSFLLIASRYRIQMERVPFIIAFGLCMHSAFLILNNTLLQHWLNLDKYFSSWNNAQMVSFQVALVIWVFALKSPLPEAQPAPTLLPRETYFLYKRLICQRLKNLNRNIQEVMKP